MMSITDDLGRDELSSLRTSSAVTGKRISGKRTHERAVTQVMSAMYH